MSDYTQIISAAVVAVIGSGGTTAIVQHFLSKTKPDPMRDGVKLLMQDKIEQLGIVYCQRGEISWAQKKYIHACYNAYKSMGGNGDVEELMNDIDNLRVRYDNGTVNK